MKRIFAALFAVFVTLSSPLADARDTRLKLPVAAALAKGEASGKLPSGVRFYFGGQSPGKAAKSLGEVRTNRKTNFFNKSDTVGCDWAFLSAMIALGERAKQLGGDAVINIRSNYRNQEFKSDTEYECGAGAVTGGVAFIGEVVKL